MSQKLFRGRIVEADLAASPEVYAKNRAEVLDQVRRETERAETQWGHEFDNKNTLNDWGAYALIYLGKALEMGADPETVVKNLRKSAGLLISALVQYESAGIAARHYDGQEKPKSLPEIKNGNQ
jgi:hypothetical protein